MSCAAYKKLWKKIKYDLEIMEQLPAKRIRLDKEEITRNDTFDTLPNEIVEIPIKMAMRDMNNTQERYDFLAEVIPKVSKRFRDIAAQKSMWQDFSPIEMLPNDVAEVIIKMAMKNQIRINPFTHSFLIDVISKVSSRFKAWAALKPLWKGAVYMEGNDREIEQALEYLNDDTTSLHAISRREGTKLAVSLEKLSIKCPELVNLSLISPELCSWPKFRAPLTSLKWLYVDGLVHNLFENVELHNCLPNIEQIHLGNRNVSLVLPNMGMCEKLRGIKLQRGEFCLKSVTDLPRGLKKLSGPTFSVAPPVAPPVAPTDATLVGVDRSKLDEYFEDCKIDIEFKI